jgi:Carboxypeptidase regulatory-like domain
MKSLGIHKVILSILTTLLLAGLALAQTGSIQGTVTDKTGAVVQGAEVTLRNLATNTVRRTTTNSTGGYSVPNLEVGHYEIAIKKEGFKVYKLDNVDLTVGQTLGADASLDPGAVTEEVLVRASDLPPVDLETSQVSNLVDSRKILDLPLITRDPYSLVLLSPGTSQTNTSLGGFTVNGSRERNNNFLLDGVDNNDTSVPGIPGGALNANPDSTEEFRVITNNFNAEYGRNTGAIVDVVTKSGSNSLHGAAYEYGRWNTFGGARDWFNRSPAKMDPYTRNQFGFSLGGPIIKNKTFFFGNAEFDRFRTTLTNSATVPTHNFKTGVFTYTDPNGVQTHVDLTPSSAQNAFGLPLDPTVQKILAFYPDATSSADGVSGTIFYPSSSKQDSYNTVAKIDHHFNDRETLSVRYGYDHSFDPDPFHDDILPGNIAATASKSIAQGLSANLTSTLKNNLINSFTFGWNRIYATFNCTNRSEIDGVSPLDQFGNARDYTMDPFSSFGCLSLVSNGQWRKTGTMSLSDNISWVRGNHTFKFGADFRNVGEQGPNSFFSRRGVGLNTFQVFGDPNNIGFNVINVPGVSDQPFGFALSDAASALYGLVASDFNAQYFNKTAVRQGTDNKKFRQHEYDWYGQDTWKVRPNLTLTLGLRYQLDGVPYEEGANFSNLLTPPDSFPVVMSIVGPGTGKSIYQQDYSNIEPRIGFSWDPWHDGKTAIRGAFGIFHDRVFGNLFGNARGNPPFEQDYSTNPLETINNAFGSGAFPSIVPLQTPSPVIPEFNGTVGGLAPVIFDPHFRNSSSNNWNFGIQRELPGQTTFDITYVGAKGTHVFHQQDGNPPDPTLVNELVQICSNPLDPRNTTGCTPSNVSGIFLYKGAQFGVLPFNAVAHNALVQPFFQVSNAYSIYHALQLKVTRRLSHGLEAQASYTLAHALDDSPDPLVPAAGNRTFPRNSRNLAQDYGNSDNDIRHVAVISYLYELPIGKGKGYLNHGVAGKVFEGMQFSGITTVQTGHPFEVRSNTDSQRTGIGAWATQVGNPSAPGNNDDPNVNQGNKVWFRNPDAFAEPTFGGPGGIARNQFYGPGLVSFDMVFAKKMSITERINAELRVEGYNIFNHPHFTNPGADPNALGNRLSSGLFGLITSAASRPDSTTSARQMQVALRVNF